MQITLSPMSNILFVTGKSELSFTYSVWGSIKTESNNDMFGLTNQYLASLPKEKQERIFDLMELSHIEMRRMYPHHNQLITILQKIVNDIYLEFDWDECLKFCRGKIVPDKLSPISNNGRNPDDLTYLREEVYELSAFCILLKVITPLIGSLTKLVEKEVGNDRKEMVAATVLDNTAYASNPAYERFVAYITTLSARRSSVNTAITHGIANSELANWRLGLAVVRRLCTAKVTTENEGSLISKIYTFLEEKTKHFGKKQFKEKIGGGRTEEAEDSIVDSYRIPTPVDLGALTIAETYLTQLEWPAAGLKLSQSDVVAVRKVFNDLNDNPHFIISKFHITLCALALKPIISVNILPMLKQEPFHAAIALSTVFYMRNGYEDIARLLVAIRYTAEIDTMQIGFGGQTFKRLPQSVVDRLEAEYTISPFGARKTKNVACETIDRIVSEIRAASWIELKDMENIGISIAEAIINRPWKNKFQQPI